MKKCIVEFIGTFFLMLSIVLTVNSSLSEVFHPLAIGAMLITMIYSIGHISGAHFNPAVTLAIWMRGKIRSIDVPGYLVAQFLGVIIATLVGNYVFGKTGSGAVDMNIAQGMTAEILGTFVLAYVILNVATAKTTAGNSYYGTAIGLAVIGGMYAFGEFGSGACFNPAVAIGTLLDNNNTMGNIVYIILANLIGGALAAIVFNATYTKQGAED